MHHNIDSSWEKLSNFITFYDNFLTIDVKYVILQFFLEKKKIILIFFVYYLTNI